MSIGFRILLVTDPAIPRWLEATLAALEIGGDAIAVQVRGPSGAAELLHLARGIRAAAPRAIVIVNDRADVARLADAHGVHLKENGVEVGEARALGARIVGASCHDARGIARRAGADYVTLGPLAEVPGKGRPLEPGRFAAITAGAPMPVLALGGIDPGLARHATASGARGVAVSRAILAARDPRAATRALLDALG